MENGQEIVLNEFNEILLIRKPRTDNCIDGAYAELGIGIHKICRSTVCSREISETHRSIFCKGCGLRIVVPKEIDTYEKLAMRCQEEIKRQENRQIFFQRAIEWIKYLDKRIRELSRAI